MPTIINNPGNGEGSGSSMSMIIGVIMFLVVIGLFLIYVLPAIQSGSGIPQSANVDVNVKLPDKVTLPSVTNIPTSPAY